MSDVFLLWNEQSGKLRQSSIIQSFVPLTFVATMGGVGLEDVAVAGFQLFEDVGFVDDTGAAVVGECAEKDGILAVF